MGCVEVVGVVCVWVVVYGMEGVGVCGVDGVVLHVRCGVCWGCWVWVDGVVLCGIDGVVLCGPSGVVVCGEGWGCVIWDGWGCVVWGFFGLWCVGWMGGCGIHPLFTYYYFIFDS